MSPADKFRRAHKVVSLVAGKPRLAPSPVPVSEAVVDVARVAARQLQLLALLNIWLLQRLNGVVRVSDDRVLVPQALGSWALLPGPGLGPWSRALGSRPLVWALVLGPWSWASGPGSLVPALVLGPWARVPGPRPWSWVPCPRPRGWVPSGGPWSWALGPQSLVLGPWVPVPGPGPWSQALGPQCLVLGPGALEP